MSNMQHDLGTLTQEDIEMQMFDLGKSKFLDRLEKEKARGQVTSAGAASKVIDNVYPAVAERIMAWLEEIRTKGRGRNPQAFPIMSEIEPELAAYIGVRVVFDLVMGRGGAKEHKTVVTIGSWIEHELRVRAFEKKHKRKLKFIVDEARQRSTNVAYLRVITVNAMNKMEDNWQAWGHQLQVSVGYVVLQSLIETGGIIERDERTDENHIVITPEAMVWISQMNDALEETRPTILPCVEPPRAWSTPYDGGYHMDLLREKYPLLTAFHRKDRLKLLEKANMPAVYRAVNAVQSTAWKINENILSTMETLWADAKDLGVLPELRELELPARLANMDNDPEVLREWKRQASEVYVQRQKQISRRLNLKRTIDVSRQLVGHDVYHVYQCDFRGRLYAQGAGPNPQGTDYQKALLLFKQGKPLGDHSAVAWLAVHGANSYGVDKVSFEERIDWTYANQDAILACAEDPMTNRMWTEASSPWLFLAFAVEWQGYCKDGLDHVTHLPISVDGTCNGLQHYSAMLRDPIGGEATNLVPSAKPQDIYDRVANVVVAKDPTLMGIVTRSVAKRPVMVLPYGGTIASCKDYVRASLRDGGHQFEQERENEIAKLVWESIGDVVVAARDGMAFLRKMASVMSKKKEHVSWVAPTGWPVLQQYFNLKHGHSNVMVFGKRIQYVTYEPKLDTVDGRRSGQGVPPNFVHSLDAAALMGMVNLCLDQPEPVTQFSVVHDSFGTLAPDMDTLSGCIRHSFVQMYEDHDVLNELRERVIEALLRTRAGKQSIGGWSNRELSVIKNLEPVPEKGKLDITAVLESPFFFA